MTPPSAELAEFIAILVLGDHSCSDDCLCRMLRKLEPIQEAMRKIGPPPVSAN